MFYAKSSNGILRKKSKTRKHPLAPKKPRSAFILFSQHMHNEKDDNCKEMNQKVYNLHKWFFDADAKIDHIIMLYSHLYCWLSLEINPPMLRRYLKLLNIYRKFGKVCL